MITLTDLTFAYPQTAPVLQNFNWQIRRGERWALLGPSGCGKTTLLYLLAGLRFPSSGELLIDGESLSRPRPHSGLILQEYGLLPWATVRENAELGLQVHGFYGADGIHAPHGETAVTPNLLPWLERLGLDALSDKYPSQLSGGQRQRTAIARTLALNPDLLLMDEPFSSLDAVTRADLQKLTLELCAEQNLTLVMVTHAIEEAAIMGQKILLLGNPPIIKPLIIDNPKAGKKDYRDSQEYNQLCHDLRQRMEVV
ncbi:MAG: ATP-binding cassette domain-containing protein [Anaerolineae bacterium]|nr:ATP-binding cassette domain-containing protein [Anaerolineae bacterium]MBT4309832.1 ATP-binding cassette domain-containing protein [Anaerolineae bacterium]MBT4460273.1 ATP-binding cassette domain-containing protein [Anaerolineae bacterium]MBT6060055.1 ATP-binding cassette domain-containing protein [Anaerolineae bacterium]MBT6324182.1 ATP-binding cassette domain-containing protein [Anaerolineae bacterium]